MQPTTDRGRARVEKSLHSFSFINCSRREFYPKSYLSFFLLGFLRFLCVSKVCLFQTRTYVALLVAAPVFRQCLPIATSDSSIISEMIPHEITQ
jgi:hypothetical protein